MRSLLILATLALTACAGNGPDTIVVRPPDVNVTVTAPEDTDSVPAEDPATIVDTDDSNADTGAAANKPCNWLDESATSLFDLQAFVSVQTTSKIVIRIPLKPNCGKIGITKLAIDGRFNGEPSWIASFGAENVVTESTGYWTVDAFGRQQVAGRYQELGYSAGVAGSADILMGWNTMLISQAPWSTTLHGGESSVMEATFPNISDLFESGRITFTVWVFFKDLTTGEDYYRIDTIDADIYSL